MNLLHPITPALRAPPLFTTSLPNLHSGSLEAREAHLLRIFENDTPLNPEMSIPSKGRESNLLRLDYEIAKYLDVAGTMEACTSNNTTKLLRLIQATEGPAVSTVIRCALGAYPSIATLRLLASSPRCREKLSTLAPWAFGPCANMTSLVRAIRWSDHMRLTELMRTVDASGLLIISKRFFEHLGAKDCLPAMDTIFGGFVETTTEFERLQHVIDIYLCFVADVADCCDDTKLAVQCGNALLRAILARQGTKVKIDATKPWMGLQLVIQSSELEVKDNSKWNHVWRMMMDKPHLRPAFSAGEAIASLNLTDKLFSQMDRQPTFEGRELADIIHSRRFCTQFINNYMSALGKDKVLLCNDDASRTGLSSACFRKDFQRVLPSRVKRLLRSMSSPKEVSATARTAWTLAATNEVNLARDCMSSSLRPELAVVMVIAALLVDELTERLSLLLSIRKRAAWTDTKVALASVRNQLCLQNSALSHQFYRVEKSALSHRFYHVESGWGDGTTADAILKLASATLDAGEAELKRTHGVTGIPDELPSPIVKETRVSVETPANTINRGSILPTVSSRVPTRFGRPNVRISPCVQLGHVHVQVTKSGCCKS